MERVTSAITAERQRAEMHAKETLLDGDVNTYAAECNTILLCSFLRASFQKLNTNGSLYKNRLDIPNSEFVQPYYIN